MSLLTRALLALCAGLFLFGAPQAAEVLPRPAGLEPDIGFWRRIFAECTTEQGLMHDNRYLGVVYEKIDLSADDNAARIERVASDTRGKYERILRTLGTGKRDDLSPEEQRVLGLWPADVTNQELREAADRVRFQQGLAERFHAGLIRSGQWREHIQKSLRAEGVPEELAALPARGVLVRPERALLRRRGGALAVHRRHRPAIHADRPGGGRAPRPL